MKKGCVYGGAHFTLQRRVFSKKFHKLFPGFQMYEPCERCYIDTQWLSKNIYIKDKQNGFVKIVLKKFVIVACSKTVMKTVIILDSMIIWIL